LRSAGSIPSKTPPDFPVSKAAANTAAPANENGITIRAMYRASLSKFFFDHGATVACIKLKSANKNGE
jgi:hypothetical protein